MPLSLRIDSTQAAQSVAAFKQALTEIRTAAATVDALNFNKLAGTVDQITKNFVNLQGQIQNTINLVGTLQNAIQTSVTGFQTGFASVRETLKSIREDITGLNRELGSTVRAAASTPRRRRASTASSVDSQESATAIASSTDTVSQSFGNAASQAEYLTRSAVALQQVFGLIPASSTSAAASLGNLSLVLNTLNSSILSTSIGATALRRSVSGVIVQDAVRQVQEFARYISYLDSIFNTVSNTSSRVFQGYVAAIETANTQTRLNVSYIRQLAEAFGTLRTSIDQTSSSYQRLLTRGPQREGQLFLPPGRGELGAGSAFGRRRSQAFDTFRADSSTLNVPPGGFKAGVGATTTAFATSVDPTSTALVRFSDSITNASSPLGPFQQKLRDVKSEKDKLDRNLKDTSNVTLPGFNQAIRLVVGALAVFTVSRILRELRELGTELFEVGKRVESLEALFRNATGSVDQAGRLFLLARDRAKELGLDVLNTAKELASLSLAAKGTSLEGEKIERLFRGISAAEAVLIQTTGQAGGLIKVFTDILGKGRLQSEELVKQLGNRLPGSIRVVAEALGKTPQELATAVQRGAVSVEEVLVRLGDELARRFGGEAALNVRRLGGAFNNLRTSIFELQELIVKGGFSQALVAAFKELQTFFENDRTRVAVAALGKTIVDGLGAAFRFIIGVLGVLRDNLTIVIPLLVTLTGATVTVGVLALAQGFIFLARAIGLVGTTASVVSRSNLIVFLAGLAASLAAGVFISTRFNSAIEGVEENLKNLAAEQERLRNLPPIINNNAPDLTRAFASALEAVSKEIRIFTQDLENQVRLFSIAERGISTLGVAYAAYEKTLARIRALERNNTFENLNEQNQQEAKSAVIRGLIDLAFAEETLSAIAKNNQDLERLLEERQALSAAFQRAVESFSSGGSGALGTQIQQDYESKVLPALRTTREAIDYFSSRGANDVAESFAGAFNEWNKALLANIINVKNLQSELRALNQINANFRELALNRVINRITRTPTSASTLAPARDPFEVGRSGLQDLGAPQTIQTTLRSLGPEFERFGKAQAERLGVNIEKFFKDNDPNRTVQQLLNEQLKHLESIDKKLGDEGGLPYPGSANVAAGTAAIASGGVLGSPQAARFAQDIITQSNRRGVDPEIIARLIKQESGFNPNAVSRSGAVGLGQFTAATASDYGLRDRTNPQENIRATVDYFADLLKQFRGNVSLALAGYNAGPQRVINAGNQIPNIAETQGHNRAILAGYQGTGVAQPGRNFSGGVFDSANQVAGEITGAISSGLSRIRDLVSRRSSSNGPYLDFNVNATSEELKRSQEIAVQSQNATPPSAGGITRLSIDIEKAETTTAIDYQRQLQEEIFKTAKPVEDLTISLERLAEAALSGAESATQAFLSPRASQELYIESLRAGEQVLNSFALTQEDLAQQTDQYRIAVILASRAIADNYASGIERAAIAGNQAVNTLNDEIEALQLQIRYLNESATTRQASLAAEQRRQALIRSGIVLDQGQGAEAEKLIETLRKLQQAQDDLNADPLKNYRDQLDQLAKTGETQVIVDGIEGIADAFANLASTANYSLSNLQSIFTSVFQSLVGAAVKLVIQLYIIKPLLASLSGGSDASNAASTILGFRNLGFTQGVVSATGGVAGYDIRGMHSLPSAMFANASRFQAGGIIGTDSIPALLTPGEGVFTAEQMKRMAPAGSGGGIYVTGDTIINATDGDSVRQTMPQLFGELYGRIQRTAQRDGLVRRN